MSVEERDGLALQVFKEINADVLHDALAGPFQKIIEQAT